jgi:chemotaxis protein MotB
MALSRRNGKRFEANIWPGFVDAMTALLLVLVFVLSIFMIVQFMLRETITTQDSELDQLTGEVATLAEALGLEQQRSFGLEQNIEKLDAETTQQAALIASLSAQNNTQAGRLASFEEQVAGLLRVREGLQSQVASLSGDLDASQTQVAGLSARIEDIEAGLAREISEKEAAQLALASARQEVNAGEAAARLAAARREALEALVSDLETKSANLESQSTNLEIKTAQQAEALSAAEAAKLVDAAAAQALRDRLQNADAELTAMTLVLETQRKDAEDTLTLLVAARAAEKTLNEELASTRASEANLDDKLAAALAAQVQASANLDASTAAEDVLRAELEAALKANVETGTNLAETKTAQEELRRQLVAALAAKVAAETGVGDALSEAEQRAALLAAARSELAGEKVISLESQRKVEALNQQVAALRTQLGSLQSILDETDARREASNVKVQNLGSELNSALALVASEQRARAKLEEAERLRLEAEAKELKNYRSEFFGQLRKLLGNQDGIRIEGDRFVFSSEVLFQPGQAVLSPAGKGEVAKVAAILSRVAGDIPDTLDWVIRVDGHTDNVPLSGFGEFKDNWELSQARALSVVRYMSSELGIPPDRLAANGFGEYQPINSEDTPEARALNRRIELKLTEK